MSISGFYFALISSAAFILCGLIPLWKSHIQKKTLALWIALGAGLMLMISVQELLPEAYKHLDHWETLSYGLAAGLIFMYILERFTDYHSCIHQECEDKVHKKNTNIGILVGLSAHNFTDGVIIGTVSAIGSVSMNLAVIASVIIHQASIAISLAAILLKSEIPKKVIGFIIIAIGSSIILGTLTYSQIYAFDQNIIGITLAFSCGSFIYVAISDLIPEAHENPLSKTPIISFLVGISLIIVMGKLSIFFGSEHLH